MDPWSKVDYSRLIREASVAMEKLPKVNPPSGRVPGHGLLAALILKRRWRWNREEITQKVSAPRFFGVRCKYRPKGGQGWTEESRRPPGAPAGPRLVIPKASGALIFYIFFPEFIGHFK